ncbi:DUF4350 domain-containing protein [Schaalia sp. ZJ1691]|uniref:DUF4350 domain-containing protein n=1 Tax=Schaalia sp. ZJ1691 TaxID=2709404 RepID=UPI0013E9D3B3|nr:DUF4350 domain-containing protein [Schaalia sp. ZJ1691]
MTSTRVITPRPRTIARRLRPFAVIAAVVLAAVLVLVLLPASVRDSRPVSPENAAPNGARAVAQVLERHGVTVTSHDRAVDVLAQVRAHPDATVVVVFPFRMRSDVTSAINKLPNLVYIGTEQSYDEVFPGLWPTAEGTPSADDTAPAVSAHCAASPARAASSIASSMYGVSPNEFGDESLSPDEIPARDTDSWTWCFPQENGSYGYVQSAAGADSSSFRAVIPDSGLVRNSQITEHGHGALMLNVLGRTDRVVWYLASEEDSMKATPTTDPPWLNPLVVLAGCSLVIFGLARGRRLGALVPEDLPTQVPASETVIGKGRLLRKNRAWDHAATALRRDYAMRFARFLGVNPRGSGDELRRALEHRGVDPARLDDLLWGPSPQSERQLVDLASRLADLEKEICHD